MLILMFNLLYFDGFHDYKPNSPPNRHTTQTVTQHIQLTKDVPHFLEFCPIQTGLWKTKAGLKGTGNMLWTESEGHWPGAWELVPLVPASLMFSVSFRKQAIGNSLLLNWISSASSNSLEPKLHLFMLYPSWEQTKVCWYYDKNSSS